MQGLVIDINQVNLVAAPAGQSQPAWDFQAGYNLAGLKIFDFSHTADTIRFSGPGQSATNIGGGADTFVLTLFHGQTITNFQSGLDHIGLERIIFGSSLSNITFDIGPSPVAVANHHANILYDTQSGALSYFDPDDGILTHFATLTGHPTLLASDFTLA